MTTITDGNAVPVVAADANRAHGSLALTMLGSVVGTCLVIVGLVHSESIRVLMRDISWEQNRVRESLPIFCFNHHYPVIEEWFLDDEIPSFDFSRGGVYFLGASSMKWTLKPWDLPVDLRPYVHNFGFGGVRNSDQGDFLRYLVEGKDMLKAGPEKTMVVFGQSYRIVHHGRMRKGEPPLGFIREQWTRHGFYSMDDDGTIRRTPGNPLVERCTLEYSKMTGFLRELGNIFYSMARRKRVHEQIKASQDHWADAMGPDWKALMDSELEYLRDAIKYMKDRKAKVAIVVLPLPSWDSEMPFQEYYQGRLKAICDAEGIPMQDLRASMEDHEFADSDHLTPDGVEKFQAKVLGLCTEHLKAAGLTPASGGSQVSDSPSR